MAKAFIDVISMLTTRNDITHTTMFKFKDLISNRHLFRENKVWCTECIKEMSLNDEVYDPLIWNIKLVKICPKHNTLLSDICWNCKNQNHIISAQTIPGYCSICFAWLGEGCVDEYENVLYQKQSQFVIELLKWSEQYEKVPVTTKNFMESLNYIIEKVFNGHKAKAALELGYNWKTYNNWQTGKSMPPLNVLVNICIFFNLTIEQYFTVQNEEIPLIYRPDIDLLMRDSKEKKNIDQNKLKEVLDNIIDTESIVTLKSIGEMFGCSDALLKHYFPSESKFIVELYKKEQAKGRKERFNSLEKKIEDTFFYLLKEGQYPTYNKMKDMVGSHVLLIPTVHQKYKDLRMDYDKI
ncbi:TniQ family protein [Bacillus sp. OV166]|uniref:TniQ family protein n=1 Tax=Bacillus sp. OV166 TaxID=1882763 RepID=UPI0015C51F17|nr:TniQ family protein [Bacillus sp. OV166]